MSIPCVKTGLDRLLESDFEALRGKRVAVAAHRAAINSQRQNILDLLKTENSFELVKVFAPEHGFDSAAQDMQAVDSTIDAASKIPIISLYGSSEDSLSPKAEDLADVDLLLIDFQDIGARYYTYTQTAVYCMKVAGQCGVKVLILDRPNPINGLTVEGSMLLKDYRSFCGYGPIANRHGLTLGEYCSLAAAGFGEGDDRIEGFACDFEIIKLEGWHREMYFDQTGLPWLAPSPNMPTLEAAILYPGTCLLEATQMSEGRGTNRPFEIVGAPYANPQAWIQALAQTEIAIAGIEVSPTTFSPTFQKHSGKNCAGLELRIIDRNLFKPYRFGLALIAAAYRAFSGDFHWRKGEYEFIDALPAIDLLYGGPSFREALETKSSLAAIETELSEFEAWFRTARSEHLLYK